MLPSWIDEITIDDLPEDMQTLAYRIGLKNTLEAWEIFEGQEYYWRKIDFALKAFRNKRIKKKWKKHNIGILAKEYDLTHNQIRSIVNDHEDQMDLAFSS